MPHSISKARVGVIACTPRTQEYARRILRSFGYAPLIFENVQELRAMGPGLSKLRMLFVGGHPADIDTLDPDLLCRIRIIVGWDVPILYASWDATPHEMYKDLVDEVVPASSQHITDLCTAMHSFMAQHGLPSWEPQLRLDAYTFHLLRGAVAFDDKEVQLPPLSFGLALELFYNAGRTVTPNRLMSILPNGPVPRVSLRKIMQDLKTSLSLGRGCGWHLAIEPKGYRLRRAKVTRVAQRIDLGASSMQDLQKVELTH